MSGHTQPCLRSLWEVAPRDPISGAIAAIADIIGTVGVGEAAATAIGTGVVDAGLGAAGGAAIGGLTHGNIGQDALLGGLTGGAIGGFGSALGAATGLGTTAGDALAGAGAGALGGWATGGNPLTGALTGGAGGLLAGGIGDLSTGASSTSGGVSGAGSAAAPVALTGSSPLPTGGGASAAGIAAPSSAAASPAAFGSELSGSTFPISYTSNDAIGAPVMLPSSSGAGGAADGGSYLGGGSSGPAAGGPITIPGVPDAGFSMGAGPISGAPNAPDAGGNWLTNSLSKVGSDLGTGADKLLSNPASLLTLGGLGLDLVKGNTPVKGQNQVSQIAASTLGQGQQLGSYLTTGTLPPGLQQSINNASNSAKAAIRSKYAALGGDSSAMQQDLANVDMQASAEGGKLAIQLLNAGLNETQLSAQLYESLMQNSLQQNGQLSQGVGSLANALARTGA